MRYLYVILFLIVTAIAVLAYLYYVSTQPVILRVSTTTSLYATGLLDALADDFKKSHPDVIIQFIAVGSGEALKRVAGGDADVVLVHAPSLEKMYIDKGVIGERRIFSYNYFVIVGPKDDPAGVKDLDPIEALRRIYKACEEGKSLFISRGDDSGTHVRELTLWTMCGLKPQGKPWYLETGSGMSETLTVANEKRAYTISDIGTFLKFKDRLKELTVLVDKGEVLVNIYSAYIVLSSNNKDLAREFVEYITSERGQNIIGNFGVKEYGQPLFYPASSMSIEELNNMWNTLSKM